MSPLARARASVVAARLAADAVAFGLGFRAVSDDDFARVVIAQGFARAPALDPSGTSWLPLPFWLQGAVMTIAGRELVVARATSVVLGIVAALLVLEAARWMLGDLRHALAGALLAIGIPWSARLGIATVPELPTAAATLLTVASLSRGSTPWRRLAGATALAASCLARYEPWFVVLPFVGFTVADAARVKPGMARERAGFVGAAVIGLAAPASWIAWNRHAHGDPFAFVARVASYKRALGEGSSGLVETAKGTVASLLAAEPELWLAASFLLVGARLGAGRALTVPPSWRRPLLAFAVSIVCLVAAGARDGAPTHHPERALLAPILLAAILVGAGGRGALARIETKTAGLAFGAAAVAIVVGGWFARHWWRPLGALAEREDHALAGRRAAHGTLPGEKVLVEVADYGYFAVLAGSGRPEDFVPDRSLDPRDEMVRSSFESLARVEARARDVGAVAVVGRRELLRDACEDPGPSQICWARLANVSPRASSLAP